jgi:flagellar biosynthesis chaperone FliJ
MRLVNVTEFESTQCRLCEKIETKFRRLSTEIERLERWRREGGTLVASMTRSQRLIMELEKEIRLLQSERDNKRRALG